MITQHHTLRNVVAGFAVPGDEGMVSFADDGSLCMTAEGVCRWRPRTSALAAACIPQTSGPGNHMSWTYTLIGTLRLDPEGR